MITSDEINALGDMDRLLQAALTRSIQFYKGSEPELVISVQQKLIECTEMLKRYVSDKLHE